MIRVVVASLLFALGSPAVGQPPGRSWVNGPRHDGVRITADLPADERLWNVGSRVDGAGMCVTTSVEMAARYAGLDEFRGFRDWCAKEPGGAWPEKLRDQITRFCRAKGTPEPPYVQYYGDAPEPLMDLIDKTGRPAAVAYGLDPRYSGRGNPAGAINHMVVSVLSGPKYGVVLDNNPLGIGRDDARQYVWMPRDELFRRMATAAGRGNAPVRSKAWVFVWLAPPAPPAPFTPAK